MKISRLILFLACIFSGYQSIYAASPEKHLRYWFYTDTIDITLPSSFSVLHKSPLSNESVRTFYNEMDRSGYQSIIETLIGYKEKNGLNDWFYYQLVRKTAQQLSPKEANYHQYTLYKWFLLAKSGYDVSLSIAKDQLLFYVRSDENIYDIPFYVKDHKQYVCLNYHDYGKIDFSKEVFLNVDITIPGADCAFSYQVTRLPDFRPEEYAEKELHFDYHEKTYTFKVKVSPQVQGIFKNYPDVDFGYYFNIPMSRETYGSLIPLLRNNIAGMDVKEGVDYLMHFTRDAFLYKNDQDNFGREKRLSPEQTLLYEHSDCDDRAALFFYLVKEIYNLPMIALLYPTHINVAVAFTKPSGKALEYKGKKYSVCDPTPQREDLRIGQLSAALRKNSFQVVYEYDPVNR